MPFDNKLSDDINELMKKLESTRKNTVRSIKSMKKTMQTESNLPKSRVELFSNPFKSTHIYKNLPKPIEDSKPQRLDLHSLYNENTKTIQSFALKNTQPEEMLISDDEEFIQDIEFDEN